MFLLFLYTNLEGIFCINVCVDPFECIRHEDIAFGGSFRAFGDGVRDR